MQLGGMLVWVDEGLACEECPAVWEPGDAARWLAYLTDGDPVRIVPYCPDCAEREFGLTASSDEDLEHLWRLESSSAQ